MSDKSDIKIYIPYFCGVIYAFAILSVWYLLIFLIEKTIISSNDINIIQQLMPDKWPFGVSLAAIVAAVALAYRSFFGWLNNHQNYYMHLSNIWYNLKNQTLENPKWLNAEYTSMYRIDDKKNESPSAYDSHAWSCWALAEDCFETYWKNEKSKSFLWWHYDTALEQFSGPILNTHELHWAWLDLPEHACRFDKAFRDWIYSEFQTKRYATITESINGTGVKATQNLETGNYIGCITGNMVKDPSANTLQVGLNKHIELHMINELRFLNHSNNPNAMLFGRNIVAISGITTNTEITIDYNATEATVVKQFNTDKDNLVCGYLALSNSKKRQILHRTHCWIKEKYPIEE